MRSFLEVLQGLLEPVELSDSQGTVVRVGEQQAFGEGAAHFNVATATGIQALVGGGGGARH